MPITPPWSTHFVQLRRLLFVSSLGIASCAALAMAGCDRHSSTPKNPGASGGQASIELVRQETVAPHNARPTALSLAEDGSLFISSEVAYAVRVDASGKTAWTYKEPSATTPSPRTGRLPETEYVGAVALPGGKGAICAWRSETGATVLLFDEHGALTAEKVIQQDEPSRYFLIGINGCIGWNGGIALLGNGIDAARQPFGWLGFVSAQGDKRFEIRDNRLKGRDAILLPDGSLVTIHVDGMSREAWLVRVSPSGRILESVTFRSAMAARLARPSPGRFGGAVLLGDETFHWSLQRFDANLNMEGPVYIAALPTKIDLGRAMLLPDGGVLAMGVRPGMGAGASWLGPDGKLIASKALDAAAASVSLYDAAALGDGQYVAVTTNGWLRLLWFRLIP